MKYFKSFLEHFELINQMITQHKTGSLKVFAKEVNLSEWRLQEYLKIIKEVLRAPLRYDNRKKTYFYDGNGSVSLSFQEHAAFLKVLNEVHQDFINGQRLGSQNIQT